MDNLRTFELSVWTIQDDFISVLESAFVKYRGKTQDGEIRLNIDGTQELSFVIPMYLYEDGEKILNPSWYSVENGDLLINTRKIKVILNKNTDEEEIYEFVIDKITQIHENDELLCEVTCTGLAFYELGKIGYKISLSSQDFYDDDLKWFNKERNEKGKLYFKNQPIANIQYWLDKFLTKLPNENDIYKNPTISKSKWYYTIQMDWSHYFNNSKSSRSTHKVYEDDNTFYFRKAAVVSETYVETSQIEEDGGVYKEKQRMIDLSESNIYNLTQNIAETFGVYCKYVYLYDEEHHIKGRIIMFYNSFLFEDNELNVTYRYQTSSIKREIDSTDLVTKMYIKTVDDYVSIIDVDENYSREDYLLNFDYLYKIGTISEDAYNYISTYETKIRNINTQLKPLGQRIYDLSTQIVKVKSKKSLLEEQLVLDDENINENKEAMGRYDKIAIVDASHPDQKALLQDPNSNGNLYYIDMSSTKGVKDTSIRIFKTLNPLAETTSKRLNNELFQWRKEYDEFGNLIQIKNIILDESESHIVYLTYKFNPRLYYENIMDAWNSRKNRDKINLDAYTEQLAGLEQDLKNAENRQKTLLAEKEAEIKYFEELMGPALREGYWQPDNYSDYGDTYVSNYLANAYTMLLKGSSDYDYFFWDEELFDNEQDIKYELGFEQNETYYPCIDLTYIWNRIYDNLDNLSFLYYDFEETGLTPHQYSSMKALRFGAGAQVCFVKKNNAIRPILLLTGLETTDAETLSIIQSHSDNMIGFYDTTLTNGKIYYSVRGPITINGKNTSNSYWLTLNDSYKAAYPRICIESLSLKTDDTNLALTIDYAPLKNYEDYILNTRTAYSRTRTFLDENNKEHYLLGSNYYITLKNSAIVKILTTELKNSSTTDIATHTISILFTFSNADSAIYQDGIGVLNDSSKPRVSYEFTINIFKENNCIKMPSKYLNHIVRINDYELKFEDTKGYISGLTLNLDHPWQDTVEIKNYTTKFEDLFSTILAQTEAMKKTSYLLDNVSSAFTSTGAIRQDTMQTAFNNFNFDYSFNNGKLTINEDDGIWATSDSGVVAMRGGGIFCATEKDAAGNWKWNTGIMPEGINGSLITAGQIDTSKLRIFAGDKIRFQMNEDGLFAYKSFFEDLDTLYSSDFNAETKTEIVSNINENGEVDAAQFVKYNENGLFLIAKLGARVLNNDKNDYVIIGDKKNPLVEPLDSDNELKRVSISWDGLTLRNYQNKRVFFANADTGDLTIAGTIYANSGEIGPWSISENSIYLGSKDFGSAESIYFGKEGLSFGDLFKINLDLENRTFNSFIISNGGTADTLDDEEDEDDGESSNYFFKIAKDSNEDENKYVFELKNIILAQDLIDSITSNQQENIYTTTEINGQNENNEDEPVFPDEAPNGSLGILYSDTIDEQVADNKKFRLDNIMYNSTSSRSYLRPGRYTFKELSSDPDAFKRAYRKYFGIKADTWNAISTFPDLVENNFPWVGIGLNRPNDEFHAMLVKVKPNKKLAPGKSFTINFLYRTQQPYSPIDVVEPERKRSQGIVVSLYKANNSGHPIKKGILIATGIYKVPFSSGHIDSAERKGRISLTVSEDSTRPGEGIVTKTTNNKDQYYYIVIYSKLPYSKIYINYNSVGVGNNNSSVSDKRAIYIKSADAWRLVSSNAGVPSYLLPKATSTVLGGVRIGSGISIASDGTISVSAYTLPIASDSTLGGIKVGSGLAITSKGVLSATYSYTLPKASSSTLGGVKVGSGLQIASDGTLSASGYDLPIASSSNLGGVKIGSGLQITGEGVLSANEYALQAATASILGGIKVGSGLIITNDGTLSVSYSYSLPIASSNELGGIKVGQGLSIDANGLLTNSYELPTATSSTLGGIKIGTGLTITDGVASATTVSYTPALNEGTLIGTLTINGTDYPIYIPNA